MKNFLIVFLSFFIIFFAGGCNSNIFENLDSKSSSEAIQFEISKLLDEGNYDAVLAHPGANSLDIAAAAMGKAGFDTTSVLKAITIMSDSADPGNLTPITGVFPNDPDALSDLDLAKVRLLADLAVDPSDRDRNFQVVLLSLVDFMTSVGKGVENNLDEPRDGISNVEAQSLGSALPGNPALVDLGRIGNDLADMVTYLPGADLGPVSDVATTIQAVIDAIDTNKGDPVTGSELENYLNNVLGQ